MQIKIYDLNEMLIEHFNKYGRFSWLWFLISQYILEGHNFTSSKKDFMGRLISCRSEVILQENLNVLEIKEKYLRFHYE